MHRGLYGQAKATHRYIPGTSGMSINASMMKSFGKVMGHLVYSFLEIVLGFVFHISFGLVWNQWIYQIQVRIA